MLVRNIRGSSLRKCRCRSWRDHWFNNTERASSRTRCSVYNCGNLLAVGGHVVVVSGRFDGQHYIVPMCHQCNMIPSDEDFDLKRGVELISANARLMECHLR
jgi:hypothetical protein